ncbi:TPA: BREX-1 system adenine-specific DNA-methyltransferase PglX, partial [Candidatus Bathyarchaeota archaeon]|nr:BREX-1 system adenine-specific DNA-methyltransferase PglX [Candidatus Bathyarchaeota archaeon]
MKKERRNNLRGVVNLCRRILEEDFERRLAYYGIMADGTFLKPYELKYLTSEGIKIRERLELAIKKEMAGGLSPRDAVLRYIRHAAFTFLNRIAALRAMEARKLIKETVIRRAKYGGRSLREREIIEKNPSLSPYDALKKALIEAFEEVSREIKVLFDVNSEYSIVFPGERACKEVIRLLTEDVTEDDWKQDDIIGWIYQYYNSEARSEYRKKKKRPDPDDIPVINQFYTPRWLVRALVDNTLGRLWLEMKRKMPKPGEAKALSEEGLSNPQAERVDEYCSYLIPLRQNPPTRKKKDVREIKILDPACGSGHFLVYAFEILYRMYLEDEPKTNLEEIPKLILENNLFGIDIDLRAVQLAALSLYLKAKEYNPNVKIKRMNLVCADARITDGDLQKKFISLFEHDVDLQRIFVKLFDELKYTYDVGSLLKVRAPFEKLFKERKKKRVQTKFRPTTKTLGSLPEKVGVDRKLEPPMEEMEKWETIKPANTLEEMLEALRKFEREGMEKKDMGTLLFAAEAEKSVGLLTLLSQKYDVIVMNPPYGDMPKSAKDYVREHYPRTHHDYYAAFIEQAVDLCEENGLIGMLTGRTFMFLRRFEKLRTEILLKDSRPEIVFDLNSSPSDAILDEATGRWAATVVRKISNENEESECIFVRLTLFEGEENKIKALENAVLSWLVSGKSNIFYPVKLKNLRKLPRMPYNYWIPDKIAKLFEKYPPLDRDNADRPEAPKIAYLKSGLTTADDKRFTRYFWEVNPQSIANSREATFIGKKWVPFVKGGEGFYSDIPFVVNWENNGEEIKKFAAETGKPVIRNERYYFKPGLCWSDIVSSALMDFRILPKGCIFSTKGLALFLLEKQDHYSVIATLNSSLLAFCFTALNPTMHDRSIGYVCHLPMANMALKNIELENLAAEMYYLKREWQTGNETSYLFIKPWILQVLQGSEAEKPRSQHPLAQDFEWSKCETSKELRSIRGSPNDSIPELAKLCVEREKLLKRRLYKLQKLINN